MDKIIVVNGSPERMERLQLSLHKVGCEAISAEHVLDVLDILQNTEVRGVVMDLSMPGTKGWSMLRNLRTAGIALPIVALVGADTSYDRNLLLSMACKAGASLAVPAHTHCAQVAEWMRDSLSGGDPSLSVVSCDAVEVTHHEDNPWVFQCVRKEHVPEVVA
ncbi:response regulator receiver protein [Magnetococcus marinus MC-1]|uniref:Response regulator receiver protein n=1 Tax=Magnetococcus marinus (strain ATCC BAA-1437 / JCM 17883 / MC-1) TaxID=156889 RepID=A0L650_MAGMM|nr:response regulator [Magnetococcus marinus]ABK43443.1 response regulator receiver protein [Magnetococcus marinus MC-1]